MGLPQILESCALRGGAAEDTLHDAEQRLGRALPDDYKAVLLESDGLEGFITPDAFLSLWSAADLASLNDGYAVAEFAPGVTLLGTDGGDTGYGFRKTSKELEYVAVPLIGMEPSPVMVIGKSFLELLESLVR